MLPVDERSGLILAQEQTASQLLPKIEVGNLKKCSRPDM
jgi:hypothetical protein